MRSTLIAALAVVTFSAPAPGAAAPATCAALLTPAELETAAGKGFEDMGPEDRGDGETLCAWMSRGAAGFRTVAVSFWDGKDAEFFETSVASTEEATSAKREALPGIGGKAALVKYEEQLTTYVQTAGGVARVVTNGLAKPQVVAIAKAVAGTPAAGTAPIAAPERIEGAAILGHPVGALALKYAAALHAGAGDVAGFTTRAAAARRQAMPKGERAESAAFVRRMVPAADALEAAIKAGGVLVVEGPKATLNLRRNESKTNPDGSVTSSSSTTAIPFAQEDGAWKVAQ